jgi:NAD(P)-dependent dehydrogenase (short-subunit alcohol dehydrogenase family)
MATASSSPAAGSRRAALASELRSLGTEAEFIRADVRHDEEVSALIDQTVARFGRLDVAVNAAGTEGKPGPATEQSAATYAATFETNVLGTVLSLKHELRIMQAQGNGSIVNISSTYGHEGAAGAPIYAASKHAVEGLTKSVAIEVAGAGVRVNAVAPGPTDTGMLDRFTGGGEGKVVARVFEQARLQDRLGQLLDEQRHAVSPRYDRIDRIAR